MSTQSDSKMLDRLMQLNTQMLDRLINERLDALPPKKLAKLRETKTPSRDIPEQSVMQ